MTTSGGLEPGSALPGSALPGSGLPGPGAPGSGATRDRAERDLPEAHWAGPGWAAPRWPGPRWPGRRRPRVFVAALLAVVGIAVTLVRLHRSPGGFAPEIAAAIGLAIVAPAALVVLLPRWPRWAVVAALAATGVFVAAGLPFGPVLAGPVVVLAAVILVRPQREIRTVVVPGVLLLVATTAGASTLRSDRPEPASLLLWAAWSVVVLLVANSMRERRARFAEARRAAARSQAERQATAVADERLRIARELHDVLAHSLSAITVQAGVGLHLLDRDPGQARAALAHIRTTSIDALDEVRGVLGVVRAGSDDAAPLAPTWMVAALPRLVALAGTDRLTATLDVDPQARDLPERLAGVVYRVVQESLTNVRRHAPRATRVEVRLAVVGSERQRAVAVTVADDGGAPPATPSAGYGLLGMRERVAAAGGTTTAGPDGDGWQVHATLPWPDVDTRREVDPDADTPPTRRTDPLLGDEGAP